MVVEPFHVKQLAPTASLYRVHVTAILTIEKSFCSSFSVSEGVTDFTEFHITINTFKNYLSMPLEIGQVN